MKGGFSIFCTITFTFFITCIHAQTLSLAEALEMATSNYGSIKSKSAYIKAAESRIEQEKRAYLPNLNLSVQNNYGTINGQNGPLYAFAGAGQSIASSGLPLAEQNWNSAFGALYLANFNWEFFTFGRLKEKIKVAKASVIKYTKEQEQEIFNHQIKVSATYLNLLAAQKIVASYQQNLNRADTLVQIIIARAKSGLIAGVDSIQARAEISNAKILLTQAIDKEQEITRQLFILLGIENRPLELDTTLYSKIPNYFDNQEQELTTAQTHPFLQTHQSKIDEITQYKKYLNKSNYPSLVLGAAYQMRGSGFLSNYAVDQNAYTHNYFNGINPLRTNYILAIGISWNITQPIRNNSLLKEQSYIQSALQSEYEMIAQQLNQQDLLAQQKITNAWHNYQETPIQLDAAFTAYNQKKVRYENGLTDLIDVTQAAYMLVRAETDRDIAQNNLWQSLLIKSAAIGDIDFLLDLVNN